MEAICTTLQSVSSDVASLCDRMISQGLRTQSQIDTGVSSIDFTSASPNQYTLAGTQGDGILEKREVYSAVIDLLENEEQQAFASSSFSQNSLPFSNYVSQNTSFRVPWLLTGDTQLLTKLSTYMNELRSELAQKHTSGSRAYNRELAKSLMKYVTDPNGLAVRGMEHASQEWTALEAINQSHEADCSEFAMVYYELCRLAGLDAKIVQVTVNNYDVPVYHFCVALRLDPNSDAVTLVDLTQPHPFNIGHREWVEIPKLSFIAYYYMNKSIQPPTNIPAAQFQFARQNLETAMALDDTLPLVYFNLGNVYYQFGDLGDDFLDSARLYLEESLRLDPDYPGATERLNQVLSSMK